MNSFPPSGRSPLERIAASPRAKTRSNVKRLSLFLATVCLCALPSCRDSSGGIGMTYTYRSAQQVVAAGSNTLDTYYYQSPIVSANWSDFLGDLQPGDIARISPSFAHISNNDGVNFDFIERAVIQIYPNEDTSTDPYLEVAFRESVPLNTGTTLDLIPSLPDFKEEFSDDQFIYRLGLHYREVPPFTFEVILDMGFEAFPK